MRGKLKIFLGFAAGVGKTYRMLREAQALKAQGRDIVLAYFEPHGRAETIALTEGLAFIPRRPYEWRGATFQDMDTEAVIARHPEIAVVDEFAHTNPPGAPRPRRWQDVARILDAGIDVSTSLNVQHIESLNDQVWHVTGVRVRETVPDWVVQEAAQIVMVDVTPRALVHRIERGVVYAPEKAERALANFFSEANLTALRELAMRQTAKYIDVQRADTTRDEILLWLTPHPSTAMLIRRGRRVADFLGCACIAVFFAKDPSLADLLHEDRRAVERMLHFCRNLRIEPEVIASEDPASAIGAYARARGVRQIFVTRHAPDIGKLVRSSRDLELVIISERTRL